jgi:hypothetical protein
VADISINAAWGGVQKGKTTTSQRHLAAARTQVAMRWDGTGRWRGESAVRESERACEREQRPSVLSVLSSPLPVPALALALALALRLTPQDKRPKVQVPVWSCWS